MLCFFPAPTSNNLLWLQIAAKAINDIIGATSGQTDRQMDQRETNRWLQPYASSITSGCSFNFNLPWPMADDRQGSMGTTRRTMHMPVAATAWHNINLNQIDAGRPVRRHECSPGSNNADKSRAGSRVQELGAGSRVQEQECSSFWVRLVVAGNIGIMVIRLNSPRCPFLSPSVLIILQSLQRSMAVREAASQAYAAARRSVKFCEFDNG